MGGKSVHAGRLVAVCYATTMDVRPSEGVDRDPERPAARLAAVDPPDSLQGDMVVLRRTTLDDAPVLLAILDQPEVARWWRRDEWTRLDETDAVTFSIVLHGAVVGCMQYSEELDTDYVSAGVDIFVSAAVHGRGVGPHAMRLLLSWLLDVRGHHRVTVDPAAANARAIHVYEKLGFRPVGVLRQYERVADGSCRDGLLMELLAGEFVRG